MCTDLRQGTTALLSHKGKESYSIKAIPQQDTWNLSTVFKSLSGIYSLEIKSLNESFKTLSDLSMGFKYCEIGKVTIKTHFKESKNEKVT